MDWPTGGGIASWSDVQALISGSGDYIKYDGTRGDPTGSVDLSAYLSKTNTTAFTPTADYHPATKKYVDDSITAGGGYTDEQAQDAAGAMFSGNTETGITVTYNDTTGKVDFVVATQSDVNFTSTLNAKLAGIATGAEVNVNADWNVSSGDAQILNKPTLGTAAALNVGTSANNIVQLNASGQLPFTIDLDSLTATNLTGNSKYYGTNALGVRGVYDLPSGGGTPTTITVADTTDTTAFIAIFDSATGDLGPKTDGGLTYNASTGMLTATGFTGPLTGTASGNLTASNTSTLTNKTIDTAATGNAITVPLNGVLDGAITDPADADDMIYVKAPNALTITDIHCLAEGGGTITITLQECTTAGASCANIEGAITCDADGAEDDGTLTDGAIAAGAWLKVLYSAPTGTVNAVAWTVYGTQTW